MIGTVRPCPPFTRLFDTLSPISHISALALKDAGVDAVGRYVETLSAEERDGLFAAGMAILPLSKAPLTPLNASVGGKRAAHLVDLAQQLGVPTGAHLMVDFEAQSATHADALAYDEAITAEIARSGYIPLAYIGSGQPLSGTELYMLPDVRLYWRGGSLSMPDPTCGYAIWQIPPLDQTILGVRVDVNMTGADLRGRRPLLWWGS